MEADLSDDELVARALGGNNNAFNALVARHEDKIFSLAYRMLGNRADALDATQDAFISAFKRLRSFRRDSAFATWLYRIAVNASHDVSRRTRHHVPIDASHDVVSGRDRPDEDAIRRLDVRAALAALPDEYRDAVVMHDLGGIPYEEIARITGTQLGTVKSRISRGRKRLAATLEPSRELEPSNKTGDDTGSR